MGRRTKKQIEADNLAAAAPAAQNSYASRNTQGVVPSVIDQFVVKNGRTIVNGFIDHNMLIINAETRSLYHLDVDEKPQTVCSVLDTLAGNVLVEMN